MEICGNVILTDTTRLREIVNSVNYVSSFHLLFNKIIILTFPVISMVVMVHERGAEDNGSVQNCNVPV